MQVICVAGKNDIAIYGLQSIIDSNPGCEVFFIPNKNDAGLDGWQPSFKKYALSKGIKEVALGEVYDIEGLVFLSLEFDRIIKPERFRSASLFNVHFSMLPKYKGMYTSALPLLQGEQTSGVTLHRIDAGIDTGDIIAQVEFPISAKDTARDLYFKYLYNSRKLLGRYIDRILSGDFSSCPQGSEGASYYSKSSIDYSRLSVDFNKCACEIANQFRAFTFREYQMPTFEAWQISGSQILATKSTSRPGVILLEEDAGFVVSTVDYDIYLKKDYYPLMWRACESGDVVALQFSLGFIDDINTRNNKGWSALVIAAYHGRAEIVEVLLSFGASLTVCGYNGTTPLMYAFSHYELHGDDKVFHLLIRYGADTTVRDGFSKNLKDYMIERNCLGLIQYV